jgi:hypothetical protein
MNMILFLIFLARNAPTIYSFGHTQSSNSILSLTFQTRTAPPTDVILQRNGLNLTIDGSTIQMTQTITNRYNSYYNNILSINDDPDNVIGNYTIVVGNSVGQVTSNTISIEGNDAAIAIVAIIMLLF